MLIRHRPVTLALSFICFIGGLIVYHWSLYGITVANSPLKFFYCTSSISQEGKAYSGGDGVEVKEPFSEFPEVVEGLKLKSVEEGFKSPTSLPSTWQPSSQSTTLKPTEVSYLEKDIRGKPGNQKADKIRDEKLMPKAEEETQTENSLITAMSTSNQTEIVNRNMRWLYHLPNDVPFDRGEVLEQQLERLQRVRAVCSDIPEAEANKTTGHTRMYGFHNVTFVVNPKSGTTNLLNQICVIVGDQCTKRSLGSAMNMVHYFITRFLSNVAETEFTDRTKTNETFRFVTVRNPWRRLVSTYIDKFIFTKEYMSQCRVKALHKQFNEMKMNTTGRWEFSDFIERCVIGQYKSFGPRSMNEHWRPQYVCGAFCAADYNFIGKLETVDSDEKVFLYQLGARDINSLNEEVLKRRKPFELKNQTGSSYSTYWKSIKPEHMEMLQSIYKYDLRMFDYPLSP